MFTNCGIKYTTGGTINVEKKTNWIIPFPAGRNFDSANAAVAETRSCSTTAPTARITVLPK